MRILILYNPCFGGGIKTRKEKLAVFLIIHIASFFILDMPHPLSKQLEEKNERRKGGKK